MMRRLVQACVLAVLAGVVVAPGVSADSDLYGGDHGSPAGAVDQGAPQYYDSGLAPTPYMGWNTYYGLGAPTEDAVKGVADFLVSSGLRNAGYDIVWLDGGWQATPPRDDKGRLAADKTRFPHGIPSIVDYLHRRGLRAGIYTDAGAYDGGKSCGLGSGGGYYERDAKQFADWKFDAIKVDFLCGLAQKLDPGTAFGQFSAAVAKSGRKMLLNLCNPVTSEWGVPITPEQAANNNYIWGPTTGDSWRTYTDLAFGNPTPGEWANIVRAMDTNAWHPEANGPGHWNDADYLLPMRKLPDGSYELNEEESTTQLVMWAQMAGPLIIGSDPRTLPQSMLNTLKNPEIIAVDQDKLGIQGVRIQTSGVGDVYSKVLSGRGQRSVVLLNRNDTPSAISVDFTKAGLSGDVQIRDLRQRKDLGTFTSSYSTTVAPHGTAMLKLSGTDYAPGADLGGDATASPALVRFSDTDAAAFTRAADGTVLMNTRKGANWSQQWTRLDGHRILGQPAAYGSAGGRIDLFVRGTDNAAYQRTFQNGRWGSWIWLGGTLTDAPTVAFTSPSSWTLFARGKDGQVWQRPSNAWWSSIGAPNGKPIYGRPSAVVDGNGPHVAVRTADDSVWIWENGAWASLGGTISGSPAIVATLGRIYLFARASDYTLWQRNFSDGSWGGWFPRGEFPSNAFDGSLGVAAGDNGSAWVAFRGVNGRVHQVVL